MTLEQFIVDLIRRICAKTPAFYRVIQMIGLVATFIMKLPDILSSMGEAIPSAQEPYKTTITVAGITVALVSQLAVSDDSKLKGSINTK